MKSAGVVRRASVILGLALLLFSHSGASSPAPTSVAWLVTVDTSAVSGTDGFLYFQFDPAGAGAQLAKANLSSFSASGNLVGDPFLDGDVSGGLADATGQTFTNDTALNDDFVEFTFGTSFSFVLTLTGPAIDSPNGTATSDTVFGLALYGNDGNPLLTNQADTTGFAGQVEINLKGLATPATTTAFPRSSTAGATSVVTFTPLGTPGPCGGRKHRP